MNEKADDQAWVVLVAWDGNPDNCEVYQTADSRAEAVEACDRLTREVSECYAEIMTLADAESLGLLQ
jgi:hypothetical protein